MSAETSPTCRSSRKVSRTCSTQSCSEPDATWHRPRIDARRKPIDPLAQFEGYWERWVHVGAEYQKDGEVKLITTTSNGTHLLIDSAYFHGAGTMLADGRVSAVPQLKSPPHTYLYPVRFGDISEDRSTITWTFTGGDHPIQWRRTERPGSFLTNLLRRIWDTMWWLTITQMYTAVDWLGEPFHDALKMTVKNGIAGVIVWFGLSVVFVCQCISEQWYAISEDQLYKQAMESEHFSETQRPVQDWADCWRRQASGWRPGHPASDEFVTAVITATCRSSGERTINYVENNDRVSFLRPKLRGNSTTFSRSCNIIHTEAKVTTWLGDIRLGSNLYGVLSTDGKIIKWSTGRYWRKVS